MKSTRADIRTTQHDDFAEQRETRLFVPVSFLPDSINSLLADFLQQTPNAARVYLLLLSLWKHSSSRTANAMAFDLFIALIPMLGIAGWATSLALHSPEGQLKQSALSSLAPSQLDEFLGRHFDALYASHLAPLGALAGWWVSSSAFNTMIGVFEETFDCHKRSWVKQRILSLGLALFGMTCLSLVGVFGVLMALAPGRVAEYIQKLDDSGLMRAGIAGAAYLSVTAFLALLYRVSMVRARKRRIWPGAFTACTMGATASVGLGYYATNLANYAVFYGGLAVIVVVLLWLWLWSTAILVGAEVNVTLEDAGPVQQRAASLPRRSITAP
ncbi:MAG TPA: YihY/virulence factor BrkB family protein [Polyangiaceae bacterium]|nr:YihY/virulence factor BrkB family protein [Polyangiaceae bacterium]